MASTPNSVSDKNNKSGKPRTPTKSPSKFKIFGSRNVLKKNSPLEILTPSKYLKDDIHERESHLQQGRVLEKARLYDEMVKGSAPTEMARRREKLLKDADVDLVGSPMITKEESIAIQQRLEAIEMRLDITDTLRDEIFSEEMATFEQVAPEQEIESDDLETTPMETQQPTKRKLKRKIKKCVMM